MPTDKLASPDGSIWLLELLPDQLPGMRPELPDIMRAAQNRPQGILTAKRSEGRGEFVLFYNEAKAMLLFFDADHGALTSMETWEGPCCAAVFPNRPAPLDGLENFCCPNGDFYGAARRNTIPRREAFLLFQACVGAGALAPCLPARQQDYTQPVLPKMEPFVVSDEERRVVEWRYVESAAYKLS